MNDFWTKKLGSSQTAPPSTAGTPRVWWQEAPQQAYQQPQPDRYQQLAPNPGYQQDAGMSPEVERNLFSQLSRISAGDLSADQMEFMAEYELKTKPKYSYECPQCGSGNFIPHGTRMGSVTMPTDKCFDCGFSARGPEPALAGRGQGTGKGTRQIDTGGAAGSMYMAFRSVPQSYIPRA